MRRLLRRDGQGRARTEQRAAGAREQGGPWGRCALLFLVLGRMNSAHPGRCVLTFATAAGTGDLSLRFEHLRRRAAYPLEALRGLCALRLIAWDLAARVAREVARAIVLESALEGVDVQVPVRATVRDPVRLCVRSWAFWTRLMCVLSCSVGAWARRDRLKITKPSSRGGRAFVPQYEGSSLEDRHLLVVPLTHRMAAHGCEHDESPSASRLPPERVRLRPQLPRSLQTASGGISVGEV